MAPFLATELKYNKYNGIDSPFGFGEVLQSGYVDTGLLLNKYQNYLVDKQEIMIGLRDGIKLMRKNEKVSFLFPSHIAYGYLGDKNRIGPNVPIICTVTLTDFKYVIILCKPASLTFGFAELK